MKPIEAQFKRIKKTFESIEITTGPVSMDVSQMHDPPMPDIFIQEIQSLVLKSSRNSIFTLPDFFTQLRDEIKSNLSMPISTLENVSYLRKILNFYSDMEEKIVENESGDLSTDLVKFLDTPLDKMLEYHQNEYKGFLSRLKEELRNELLYISAQIQNLEMKKTNLSSSKISSVTKMVWKRDKNDLIELVRALKLIGAINNSTNDIEFTEAYMFFGDIFNIELKRPSDQLRHIADSLDTPYFLEELLEKYKEDQKILKKKRDSKSKSIPNQL